MLAYFVCRNYEILANSGELLLQIPQSVPPFCSSFQCRSNPSVGFMKYSTNRIFVAFLFRDHTRTHLFYFSVFLLWVLTSH